MTKTTTFSPVHGLRKKLQAAMDQPHAFNVPGAADTYARTLDMVVKSDELEKRNRKMATLFSLHLADKVDACDQASRAREAAEARVMRAAPPPPPPPAAWRDSGRGAEVHAMAEALAVVRGEGRDAEDRYSEVADDPAWAEWIAAVVALDTQHDVIALRRAEDVADEAFDEAVAKLMETPAITPELFLLKVEAARHYRQATGYDTVAILEVLSNDLKRVIAQQAGRNS